MNQYDFIEPNVSRHYFFFHAQRSWYEKIERWGKAVSDWINIYDRTYNMRYCILTINFHFHILCIYVLPLSQLEMRILKRTSIFFMEIDESCNRRCSTFNGLNSTHCSCIAQKIAYTFRKDRWCAKVNSLVENFNICMSINYTKHYRQQHNTNQ